MKKVLFSIGVIVLALATFFVLQSARDSEAGQVTILLHDGDQIIREDTFAFLAEETLFDVLNKEYDLVCANLNYQPSETCSNLVFGSPVILGIEGIMTDWTNQYFAIYLNEEYST
jgi:hypothetical protein